MQAEEDRFFIIKFVLLPLSMAGGNSGSLPGFEALEHPCHVARKLRIVCMPSASCVTSPGVQPWAMFQ